MKKKRIWKRITGTAVCVLLAAGAAGMADAEAVRAGEEAGMPSLACGAVWTEEDRGLGELHVTVSGLNGCFAAKDEEEIVPGEAPVQPAIWRESAGLTGLISLAAQEDAVPGEAVLNGQAVPEEESSSGEEIPPEEEPAWEESEETQEGTEESAGTDAPAGGEEGEPLPVPCTLALVADVSEYFLPNAVELPEDVDAEEIAVQGHTGELAAVTRLVYLIPEELAREESLTVRIPLLLREEFRKPEEARQYPVDHNAELEGEYPGSGVRLVSVKDGEIKLLASAEPAFLQAEAAPSDFGVSMTANCQEPKAGETITYDVLLTNSGAVPLGKIELKSVFSKEGINGSWQTAEGMEAVNAGGNAVLSALGVGEVRHLFLTLEIPENQTLPIEHTVYASAARPSDPEVIMRRQAFLCTAVTPLKVDFTVEKTADCRVAFPGDTIGYRIRIRNTGERTLHSVLSTERFQAADVQARFVEREGIRLNSTGDQALIPQIAPGEVCALEAVVTLPQDAASGELVNQVTVITDETGSSSMQSQASVQISRPRPALTVTSAPAYAEEDGQEDVYIPENPRTMDASGTEFWAGILGLSFLTAEVVFLRCKGKRKH